MYLMGDCTDCPIRLFIADLEKSKDYCLFTYNIFDFKHISELYSSLFL